MLRGAIIGMVVGAALCGLVVSARWLTRGDWAVVSGLGAGQAAVAAGVICSLFAVSGALVGMDGAAFGWAYRAYFLAWLLAFVASGLSIIGAGTMYDLRAFRSEAFGQWVGWSWLSFFLLIVLRVLCELYWVTLRVVRWVIDGPGSLKRSCAMAMLLGLPWATGAACEAYVGGGLPGPLSWAAEVIPLLAVLTPAGTAGLVAGELAALGAICAFGDDYSDLIGHLVAQHIGGWDGDEMPPC